VNAVTLAVNGGYNGLADRKARLENVKKLLGV
jgi:predicted chitinase